MINDNVENFVCFLKVYTMERIEHIDSKECKGQKTITIHLKGGNEPRLMLSPQVRLYIHTQYRKIVFFSHYYSLFMSECMLVCFCIFSYLYSACILYTYIYMCVFFL